jgi:hypothetical protein
VDSDLFGNIINQILPTVKKYFDPLSDSEADIVHALLKDLKDKTDEYLFKSSSAFQNLREVMRTLQPRLKDMGQDLASCVLKERRDVSDVINAAGSAYLTTFLQLQRLCRFNCKYNENL